MNQRDLAKDKEYLESNRKRIESHFPNGVILNEHIMAEYYISNYEYAIHLLEFDKNALEKQDALIERLRGRIKELEALLHPNNRPDVQTLPSQVGRPQNDG